MSITEPTRHHHVVGNVSLRPNQFREMVPRLITDDGQECNDLNEVERQFLSAQPAGTRVIFTRDMFAIEPGPHTDPGAQA